ncbi:MAG: glutathione S-transferase family protein [Hyphomicrobiaceae bacterium TMED74]|nr:glutathione S-transferase [Filomicrobium sp.]RPG35368.1 MAG: glutathione S-transferase family protein [Hyphomicrobiaceae bacterium TMED74]
MTQATIDLYFWPTSNGHKVTIMLEECELPYKIQPVNIGKGDQFEPDFLKIAPNNRMPAIVDPDGPGGEPISIFESGAILQYLGRKTSKFYPSDERQRTEVEQWVYWQMAGLGPMAGQANHFRNYAPEKVPYAAKRYTDEVNRLYGVLDGRLAGREYICDKYTIADIIIFPWIRRHEHQGQDLNDFPNIKPWFERVSARPAVQRGLKSGADLRPEDYNLGDDKEGQKVLFGQRAR